MNPFQRPEIVSAGVQVGVATINKDTIPRGQQMDGILVEQGTIPGYHKEEQQRGQVLTLAGMGFECLQLTNLLQMEQ